MANAGLTVALLSATVAGVAATASQSPLFGPFGVRAPIVSTEVRERVPAWMELPRQARIVAGDGLRFSAVHNSAVSSETLRIGVLVGALRNDGDCATNLSARLQYVDTKWQPMGPSIPNEARVSRVAPRGLMPFRFRLRNIEESAVPPSAYVVVVEQDDRPLDDPFAWNRWVPSVAPPSEAGLLCPDELTAIEAAVTSRGVLRDGFIVGGTLTIRGGEPVQSESVVITAVLRDARQQVLEVMVGTPARRERALSDGLLLPGRPVPFRLRTDLPVGGEVATVDVLVEVLAAASMATPPR